MVDNPVQYTVDRVTEKSTTFMLQMIYSSFGCTQGWFCTACSVAPRAR
jgi:hypothetical protein